MQFNSLRTTPLPYRIIMLTMIVLHGCDHPASEKSEAIPSERMNAAEFQGTSVIEPTHLTPVVPAPDLTRDSHRSQIRFRPLHDDVFPAVIPANGAQHEYATILESLGSGGAAIDFDQDGLIDAVIAGGGDLQDRKLTGRPLFLLKNRRESFADCTVLAGLSITHYYNHGVAAADDDGDGFQDIVLTGYGGVQFFRNLGDGTFESSVSTIKTDEAVWSSSAAWGDLNRDGLLDLYVTGYVNWSFANDPPCFADDGVRRDNCSPKLFEPLPDFLFINGGDGTFDDGSREFGLRTDGKSLGVVIADLDEDGYSDVYVGNDVMVNFLYQNELGKSLKDISVSSGAGVSSRGSPDASMGVEVADFNLDGRPDLWAANFEMESFAIYQNQGNLLFRHMSDAAGISAIGQQYVGWGSVFADFDLDGDEDLCVCNGNVVRYPKHSPALQRMLLMENIEGTWFSDVTADACDALMVPQNGRGLAVTDWNRDGRLDLLATPTNSPALLLENTSDVAADWLTLTLVGTMSSRQPVGARLELHTSSGVRTRQLKGGGSYASTSVPEIHFGIPAESTVDELIVFWPSGSVQRVVSPALRTHLCLIEAPSLSAHSETFSTGSQNARCIVIED